MCALCVPRCQKRAKIDVLRLLFHSFSGWKKIEMSSWNPVTSDRTPVQHLTHETKQAGMEWEHATSLATAWGNLKYRTWTSVTRSDPLVWKCNPTQHTSDTWVTAVISMGTSCFLHPIHSPGLALSNCHLFGLLKQYLGGHQLLSYEGVEMAVCNLLQVIQPGSYDSRILNSSKMGQMHQCAQGLCRKTNNNSAE